MIGASERRTKATATNATHRRLATRGPERRTRSASHLAGEETGGPRESPWRRSRPTCDSALVRWPLLLRPPRVRPSPARDFDQVDWRARRWPLDGMGGGWGDGTNSPSAVGPLPAPVTVANLSCPSAPPPLSVTHCSWPVERARTSFARTPYRHPPSSPRHRIRRVPRRRSPPGRRRSSPTAPLPPRTNRTTR